MKSLLKNHITDAINRLQAAGKLPAEASSLSIQIERVRDPKFGDFACNIALLLAKACGEKPLVLADMIVKEFQSSDDIVKVNIAAPGFINFQLSESVFQQTISDILGSGAQYGQSTLGGGKSIHMEFVSSNPTGPLHVGHGRHAAYGASLANILDAAGYKVFREYYVNDAGRQMRLLTISVWLRYLALLGENMPFPRAIYKGQYVIEMAEALLAEQGKQFLKPINDVINNLPVEEEGKEDAYADALALRTESLLGKEAFDVLFQYSLKTMVNNMRADLEEFGVTYDRWFYESELFTSSEIQRGIEKLRTGGFLYEAEGATWFKSTEFGDEKDRVVIRANGQTTYFASDVAYHLDKYERGFDQILGVYGSDHHGYVPRLNALVQALAKDVKKLHILLVQFAILYRGKVKASMSTRGGDFVMLRELREEVGNDAARLFYILRKREQHLDFDLELAKSNSNDNPVYYIQYAYARICSVFRQLAQRNLEWKKEAGLKQLELLNTPQEKTLLRCLSRYPEVIELSANSYEPATVVYYLQELSQLFHAYYNANTFLIPEEELRNARLGLISATKQVIANGLTLLGVSRPERM